MIYVLYDDRTNTRPVAETPAEKIAKKQDDRLRRKADKEALIRQSWHHRYESKNVCLFSSTHSTYFLNSNIPESLTGGHIFDVRNGRCGPRHYRPYTT